MGEEMKREGPESTHHSTLILLIRPSCKNGMFYSRGILKRLKPGALQPIKNKISD